MELFDQLFAKFDSQDSLAILFITLLAFLFGLVVGLLLRAPRIRKLRRALKESEDQQQQLRDENALLREQLQKKDAEVRKVNADLVNLNGRINDIELEKGRLSKEIFEANLEVDRVNETNQTYMSTIEDLNNQVIALKMAEEERQTSPPVVIVDEEGTDRGIGDTTDNMAFYDDTRDRMELFEEKLNRLERENETLKMELDEIKYNAPVTPRSLENNEPILDIVLEDETAEVAVEDLELPWQQNKSVLEDRIIVTDHNTDDLTLINGIGPFLEKKLNQLGVFTFEQISHWDRDRIHYITDQISYFPGRIEKDDWVGQAIRLNRLKEEDPDALASMNANPNDQDDLKIVEGIGPKIEQLLKDAGIMTWHDLADAEVEDLVTILTDAGSKYRVHDPSSWPKQARFAAEGRWDELDQYKASHKRGKEEEE